MDDLLSEKEQIEAMRGWWRENGRYIISGIVIGVALLVGWNYWNSQRAQSAIEASNRYEALMVEVADGDTDAARDIASELYENYGSTVYAEQARLAMARLYMDKGRDQDAAAELSPLLETAGESEAALIGRLRLARILLYQEKPQEAVDLLQGYRDTAFAARYSEALGDAYAALDRMDDAREAYTVALADNPNAPTVNRNLVQMKINDLPRPAAEDVPAATEDLPDASDAVDAQDALPGQETGE